MSKPKAPTRPVQMERLCAEPACPDCPRTDKHIHCPECGSTEHGAAYCDAMG